MVKFHYFIVNKVLSRRTSKFHYKDFNLLHSFSIFCGIKYKDFIMLYEINITVDTIMHIYLCKLRLNRTLLWEFCAENGNHNYIMRYTLKESILGTNEIFEGFIICFRIFWITIYIMKKKYVFLEQAEQEMLSVT